DPEREMDDRIHGGELADDIHEQSGSDNRKPPPRAVSLNSLELPPSKPDPIERDQRNERAMAVVVILEPGLHQESQTVSVEIAQNCHHGSQHAPKPPSTHARQLAN